MRWTIMRSYRPPLTISTTAASAQPMPVTCHGRSRSPRTIRASSTVLAGYSEDSVTTMLSGPCRVASRYRALASMSITPAKMTSAVTCAGIRRDRPPAIAMTAKSVVETVRATSSGHMPAVDPAWANDRRNTPIAIPATSAVPTPDWRLRGNPGSPAPGCVPPCCWLTSTIETIPSAMPATASGIGRSPSNTDPTAQAGGGSPQHISPRGRRVGQEGHDQREHDQPGGLGEQDDGDGTGAPGREAAGEVGGAVEHCGADRQEVRHLFLSGRRTVPARGGPLEQQGALARIAGKRRGTLELGARFGEATELVEQIATHGGQQVVSLECRLRRQRIDDFEAGCRTERHRQRHRPIEVHDGS